MSKLSVTNFSKRTGSPYQNKSTVNSQEARSDVVLNQEVSIQKSQFESQKQKQQILQEKVNKKTAEIQSTKATSSEGFFTEVQSHGAFQGCKRNGKSPSPDTKCVSPKPPSSNGTHLMGFPSSANDLALEAKSDLESDKNISEEVKEKVIKKLFGLVAMVQHTYESKVRIMTEYEKFKEKYLKEESKREREHAEQLYKLNINFQSEVIQAIQQLRTELDLTRCMSRAVDSNNFTVSAENLDICTNCDDKEDSQSNSLIRDVNRINSNEEENELVYNNC